MTPIATEGRVLIVEDDDGVVVTLTAILTPFFLVERVRTIAEAFVRLDACGQPRFNAILLDLLLPNGTGIAVVKLFQERYASLPVVVVTGCSDVDAKRVIEAGAHSFLRKGAFTNEQLIDTLIQTVARHKVRSWFAPHHRAVQALKEAVRQDAQKCQEDSAILAATAMIVPPVVKEDRK